MEDKHESDDQSIVQKLIPAAKLERRHALLPIGIIDVPAERFRHVSEEKTTEVTKSIRLNGLLHQIGVRMTDGDTSCAEWTVRRVKLMYGKSRLDAVKRLGGVDIEAIVFAPETTDDQAKLFELAENYHRTELTPEERRIHRLEYAKLLKKTGAVVSRREKQGKSKTAATKAEGKKIDVNPVDDNKSDESETITERMLKAFGVSRQALAKDMKKAIEIAQEHGVEIDASETLETMDADKLGEVVDANAKQAAEEKRQLTMNSVLADAAKQKSKKEKIVDPIKVMITKMWQTYSGKTVTIDLFRQIVADATEIPGRAGIVKATLAKFDPPVHRQDALD